MTNVGCSGTEKRLIDCPHSKLAVTACGDGQYAGVRCLGKKQHHIAIDISVLNIYRGM